MLSVNHLQKPTERMVFPGGILFSFLLKLICHGSIPLLGSRETLAACTRRRVLETRSFTTT